jgi:hypothetical protein
MASKFCTVPRVLILLQCLLSVACGVVLASCLHQETSAAPLTVVVSGDTQGWITPCGCTANQSGGLLRRGSFLKQLRANGPVLYADAGGAPAGTSEYQKLRFESVLAGEREMGIAAHNIGGPEAALGPDYLRELQTRLHPPLISANLRDAGGEPVAPAFLLVTEANRKVLVTGVLSRRFATPAVQISDPLMAVREVIAAQKGRYDTLLVLAYLPDDEIAQLAAALPEADAVIGGPTGQSIAPKAIGPTVLAAATRKGKYVVQLDLPRKTESAAAEAITGKIVELTGTFPDDAVQLQNLDNYRAGLKRADFRSTDTGLASALVTTAEFRIAGSAACASCHKEDHSIWVHTGHAHAWKSLVAKRYEVDPFCQQCHTTGYGLPDGFVSASRAPHNVDVGCENCHGPSQAHVRNPKVRTPYQAADQCVRCHDAENSPTFAYDAYWEKIKHGSVDATQEGEQP